MHLFEQKTAVITGAASGIGLGLAKALAREDARLILADINADALSKSAVMLTSHGAEIHECVVDVSDAEAVQEMIRDAAERFGTIDYLFNNAGIAIGGEARDLSAEDWRKVLDVNLHGVVNGVTAAWPIMVRQSHGHIVSTASLAGLIPFPYLAPYVAAKHAVVGLSETLRIEGADLGIKVSVVCPGYIKTDILQHSRLVNMDREKVHAAIPERWGISPDECARRILRGVRKNKAVIVITGLAKIAWWWHKLFPGDLSRWMTRQLRKARSDLGRNPD